jgi:hypothetical protein
MGAILLGEFGAIGLDLVAAIPLHHAVKPTAALATPPSVNRRPGADFTWLVAVSEPGRRCVTHRQAEPRD